MANSLVYAGQTINARGDMLSLTDMWRAAGADATDGRRPSDWIASKDGRRFIEFTETTAGKYGSDLIQSLNENGTWNTWAHWQIGLAYAKYLSPDFHMWCNQVVRDHMVNAQQPEQYFPMAPLPTSLTMQCAAAELQAYALIGELLAVPKHVTFQEGLKYIDKTYSVDLFPMFSASAHNDSILEHDVMLEPTELGKRFGLSAVEMNRWLAEHDLQVKTSTGWAPTDRGALISSRHSWSNKSKSGYNLKWSLSAVQRNMEQLAEVA